jgi:Uma2 family endonuclease
VDNAITKIGMPLDEFIEEGNKQPFELINGERMPKLPNVFGHSETLRAIFLAIYIYISAKKLGEVYSETTFILPDADDSNWVTGSRIPDVMFFANDRVANYKVANPQHCSRPLALIPDLVIVVVSPTDKISEMDEKIDIYLADGVRLVITLDPQRRKAALHTSDIDHPIVLKEDAILKGGDVLPGFEVPLKKLFE